jgi:mannan endo-1,4-beta-mannosidase
LADIQRLGRHRHAPPTRLNSRPGRRVKLPTAIGAVCVAVAMLVVLALYGPWRSAQGGPSASQHHGLPVAPQSYIGLYARGVPSTYGPVKAFTMATGVKPDVVVYYSGWREPFQAGFAATVARQGAVPLVQINPTHVSIAAIASGRYDTYLSAYATAVRAYRQPVILSFGHEMNGYWYSWGYTHTSPAIFVAAWRHIVTLFRTLGAQNVTWLWTINTIHTKTRVPSPEPWWPGNSYVNWVGVDGYYTSRSAVFASVFGPTIVYLRKLTHDPILIAETSATPAAIQPAKIADLFAGVRLYRLLGFVWFNSVNNGDWRINSPPAFAAFRQGAEADKRPER